VGPTAGLEVSAKRKLCCTCQDSNHDPPGCPALKKVSLHFIKYLLLPHMFQTNLVCLNEMHS
jgi:hypothetical protein